MGSGGAFIFGKFLFAGLILVSAIALFVKAMLGRANRAASNKSQGRLILPDGLIGPGRSVIRGP